eukprot:5077945-Amphidinium_carterae.1
MGIAVWAPMRPLHLQMPELEVPDDELSELEVCIMNTKKSDTGTPELIQVAANLKNDNLKNRIVRVP